jgi:hypothetical protein
MRVEFGRTDDFCYNIAENPVRLRDLHATLLHILGRGPRALHAPLPRPSRPPHRRRGSPRCGRNSVLNSPLYSRANARNGIKQGRLREHIGVQAANRLFRNSQWPIANVLNI